MGEKIALEEGDIELTCPFGKSAEGQQNGQENGERIGKKSGEKNGQENGEVAGQNGEQTENAPAEKKFVVGSLRRAVRVSVYSEVSTDIRHQTSSSGIAVTKFTFKFLMLIFTAAHCLYVRKVWLSYV